MAAIDFSGLSDDDFNAIGKARATGDFSGVSPSGMMVLQGQKERMDAPAPKPKPRSPAEMGMVTYKGMNVFPSLVEKPKQDDGIVKGTGAVAALGEGAYHAMDRLGGGLWQSIYSAAPESIFKAFGKDKAAKLADLAQEMKFKEAAYKPIQNANPILTKLGESAPAVAASLVAPVTGPASALTIGALSSGVPEFLSYGTPEERLKRGGRAAVEGGVGGLAGWGASKIISGLITPFKGDGLSAEGKAAAERLGVKLTAGQKTENPVLLKFENQLSQQPGYSSSMQAIGKEQQATLNTAAAKAMGENSNKLSSDVFNSANTRIGGEFDRLNALATPDVSSPAFEQAIRRIEGKNNAMLNFKDTSVDGLVQKALDMNNSGASLSGPAYQQLRTSLGKRAQDAAGSQQSGVAGAFKGVQKALDDEAARSLPTDADRTALEVARKQWAAYKALTKGSVTEGNDVGAKQVGGALQAGSPDRYKRGLLSSDLMDIARYGEHVSPTALPRGLMGTPLDTSKNVLASGFHGSINHLIGGAAMSPGMQAWLGNQVLTPEMGKLIPKVGARAGISTQQLLDEYLYGGRNQ